MIRFQASARATVFVRKGMIQLEHIFYSRPSHFDWSITEAMFNV